MTLRIPRSGTGPARVLAPLALAAKAALAAGGCGSSPIQRQNRYVNQLNQASDSFNASVRQLQSAPPARTPAQALTSVGAFEAALTRVDDRFRQIHAPERVAPLHRRVIKLLERYGAQVRVLVSQAAGGSHRVPRQTLTRFLSTSHRLSNQINSTIAQINARLAARG